LPICVVAHKEGKLTISLPHESDLPKSIGKPAQRALAGAGYQRLDQLAQVSEAELKRLHGIGPKAINQLRQTLAGQGLAFAADK
jgi:predicted flap endonuclease-1-like 5' DNA nuclease